MKKTINSFVLSSMLFSGCATNQLDTKTLSILTSKIERLEEQVLLLNKQELNKQEIPMQKTFNDSEKKENKTFLPLHLKDKKDNLSDKQKEFIILIFENL